MSASQVQIWIHFALKPTYTPGPELRRGAANSRTTSHRRGQREEEHSAPRTHSQLRLARSHARHARNENEDETKPISRFRLPLNLRQKGDPESGSEATDFDEAASMAKKSLKLVGLEAAHEVRAGCTSSRL